jgi:hypothetical protein
MMTVKRLAVLFFGLYVGFLIGGRSEIQGITGIELIGDEFFGLFLYCLNVSRARSAWCTKS